MDLQKRVTNMLFNPKGEWTVIAAEASDAAALYREYAAILAAIPAICTLIGMSMIGVSMPIIGRFRVGIGGAFSQAVVGYVLGLVGLYVAAIVIDKLAPNFQSKGGVVNALKLVVYSMTPVWVAGVLYLVPALAPLALLAGLYAIYLFYIGVVPLLGTPADKVIPLMLTSALVIIVINILVTAVAGSMTGVF